MWRHVCSNDDAVREVGEAHTRRRIVAQGLAEVMQDLLETLGLGFIMLCSLDQGLEAQQVQKRNEAFPIIRRGRCGVRIHFSSI